MLLLYFVGWRSGNTPIEKKEFASMQDTHQEVFFQLGKESDKGTS